MNLGSSKGTEAWTEIWDRAAQIDFAVSQCRTDQELMSKLAMDDTLEMHLRRLASIKFRLRTGDKSAAEQMLALHAPGASADIAPTWLVADVTQHSKTEHQRTERLSSAATRSGGGGDSGGKGRGAGGGQKSAYSDNPKGRGKGRGDKGKGDKGRGRGRGGGGQQAPPHTTQG